MGRPGRFALLVGAALSLELAVPTLHAQQPPPGYASGAAGTADAVVPTRSMTLSEALDYAHGHQPAIRAALARIGARSADSAVEGARWLPAIGATAQAYAMTANNTTATYVQTPYLDLPRIGATAATSGGTWVPSPSTLVATGLSQEVFDFGRIAAGRAAADAIVEVARADADEARLDVDFAVEEAFFGVLAAQGVVDASEQAYERSRVHRDFAKRGVDSGMRPPIDLTRAEADLTRFDVGRVRARGGLAVARSVLAASIGASDAAVGVRGPPPTPAEMPTLDEALRKALAREPRIQATLARLVAAEERTRSVGAELRPDLAFIATLSARAGGAPPSSGPTPSGDGWIPDVPNWSAGLVLSWPLFEATVSARRDAAHAEESVERATVDVVREEQLGAVRRAFVEVGVARAALAALANEVAAARANYDQADARFRAGIGTAVEVADAETVRTDADIAAALGAFDVARARATFGRLVAETP